MNLKKFTKLWALIKYNFDKIMSIMWFYVVIRIYKSRNRVYFEVLQILTFGRDAKETTLGRDA